MGDEPEQKNAGAPLHQDQQRYAGTEQVAPDSIRRPPIDWQPLDTAPRDGTVVDLWHKDGFRITDQWWDATEGDECWVCLYGDDQFTHWKPITEPNTEPGRT